MVSVMQESVIAGTQHFISTVPITAITRPTTCSNFSNQLREYHIFEFIKTKIIMHITPLSITIVKITNKHLEIKQGAEKVH